MPVAIDQEVHGPVTEVADAIEEGHRPASELAALGNQ
jgi:hypothetical protein